jgi:hypothetical protein
VALVKRRVMDAVAVEVPAEGPGGGERGRNAGARSRSGCLPTLMREGCSSRILRRDWTVSLAQQPSSDEESSWIVGQRWRGGRDAVRGDVGERGREVVAREGLELFGEDVGVVLERELDFSRSVLVLVLLEWRRREAMLGRAGREHGAGVEEPEEERVTSDDSMLYAGVDGSEVRSVTVGGDAEECRLGYEIICVGSWELPVKCEDEGTRRPRVDGRIIVSKSVVDATYWVRARGGGEIR